MDYKIKTLAVFVFRYFLLYFLGGIVIVAIVFGVHMLADVVIPDSDGGSFPSILAIGLEPTLIVIAVCAALIGSWKAYKDFVVAPRKHKLAFSQPPLSLLGELDFVFDGDYFKKAESGYLVLITYNWIDNFKPKGSYMVGVLYDYEHLSQKQRLEKSAALERKYENHEPAVLFFENFAYQLFPQIEGQPVELKSLLEFKDMLIRIMASENEPTFSTEKIAEAMAGKLTTVFAELDGLI